MNKIAVAILLLALSACEGSVEGDVFIIKGDGSVSVSPGRTVSFIPNTSERAIMEAASEAARVAAISRSETKVSQLCTKTLPQATEWLNALVSSETKIEAAGNVPKTGCGELEQKREELEARVSAIRAKHLEEENRLKAAVMSAKKARQTAIANKAREMRRAEERKVVVKLVPDVEYHSTTLIKLTNNSDFCIGGGSSYPLSLTVEAYGTDGLTKVWSGRLDLDRIVDEFGFSLGDCRVQSGITKTQQDYTSRALSNPEVKKAAFDGLIATYRCSSYGAEQCARFGSWSLKGSYDFYRVSRIEKGTNVSYESTKVDWTQEALKTQSFARYDEDIRRAERDLAKAQAKHKTNVYVKAADENAGQVNACLKDAAELAQIRPLIDLARASLIKVSDCRGSSANVASGLSELNEALELGIEVPDIRMPYRATFATHVIGTLSGKNVTKVDTNIQGHYSIEGVSPGEYLIFAEYADNFVQGFWLEEVIVARGTQNIDLNQNSFVSVPFASYIREASYSCDPCTSGTEPIPSRDTLIERVENSKEALEALSEELEETMRQIERTIN